MYFNIILKNAKHSIGNYLIYIVAMIFLFSILQIASYIAIAGNIHIHVGPQVIPIHIPTAFIVFLLITYINDFMIKQRSKELASYLLMGMSKKSVTKIFLIEFCILGILCFSLASLICFLINTLILHTDKLHHFLNFFISALLHSCFYFCILGSISLFYLKKKFDKLEIRELLLEKRKNTTNEAASKIIFWRFVFYTSFIFLLLTVFNIATHEDGISTFTVSIVPLPSLLVVISFYQLFFNSLMKKRKKTPSNWYQGDTLYLGVRLTSNIKHEVSMNSVFSICVLFSFNSFILGFLLLHPGFKLSYTYDHNAMIIIQLCLSIFSILLYFIIVSLQTILNIKQQAKDIYALFYLGKDIASINRLIRKQIFFKLSMPTIPCLCLSAISILLTLFNFNQPFFGLEMNYLLYAICIFILCLLCLFTIFFLGVYIICKKHINSQIN